MIDEKIKRVRENTEIAENILFSLIDLLNPGMTTFELNQKAREDFKRYDALPSTRFLNAKEYMSLAINDEVLFGEISEKKKVHEGDVVKIALGVFKNGYFSDIGYTVIVGRAQDVKLQNLIRGTQKALINTLHVLNVGTTVAEVSTIIEKTLSEYTLAPIHDIMGHGIGRNLHEPPTVPNCINLPFIDYAYRFKEHDIVCIEPFATTGSGALRRNNDHAFNTLDRAPATHFEFPILLTKNGAQPLAQKIFASLHHDITPKPPGTVEWE